MTPFNGIYNIKFNSASVVRNVRNVEEPIANCFDAYIIPVTEEEIGQEINEMKLKNKSPLDLI